MTLKYFVAAAVAAALGACSDDEQGYLPETMAEENLPAVDTVEVDEGVDVRTVDVGNDAVAVPVEPEQPSRPY